MKYFLALCCMVLGGCATLDWGEFDGQRTRMADPDVYDVIVVAADGMQNFDERTRQRLKPGFHLLQLASSKPGRPGSVATVPLPLNVKPCTRYSFVAKHHQRASVDDWELISAGETQMAGCDPASSK